MRKFYALIFKIRPGETSSCRLTDRGSHMFKVCSLRCIFVLVCSTSLYDFILVFSWFESICRLKSVFFDDFRPTNRGQVCHSFGNTAGDTQTSSSNRRSALVAESSPIIGQNRPKSTISGSLKSVSVTKCHTLSRHHDRPVRSI